MDDRDFLEAEARQNASEETLERIETEGATAYADRLGREDNPYIGHPEPHYARSWTGGWAQACLGIWKPYDSQEERDEEARQFLLSLPR
jgi:hypothetical protein